MNRDLVIAIDGPAASGKSTTARLVARHFGYVYVDSGAMYRAVTLAVLRDGVDPDDEAAVVACALRHDINLHPANDGAAAVLLDGADVSGDIRTPDVTAVVSTVSSYSGVRRRMVEMQRQLGRRGGVVMDGRDIGTTVFPDADLKIYMKADLEQRALRRFDELEGGQPAVESLQHVRDQLDQRDRLDSTRKVSPLSRAADARELDTSNLTIDEQVARVIALADRCLQSR